MALSENEAFKRLRQASRQIDPSLVVERGSVHWIDGPFPGVSYNLVLGDAHALLFLPAADIDAEGWESRLAQRLESSYEYLAEFRRPQR